MTQHELESLLDRDRRQVRAGLQEMFCLAENPRMTHGRAPDHHAANVRARLAQGDVSAAGKVAIADDRNLHRARHLRDHIPIGLPGVALSTRASMHGDGLDAGVFENAGDFGSVDTLMIPADAHLRCHWNGRAFDQVTRHAGEQRAVLQQRRTAVLCDYLVHRTTKIDVNKIWTPPVDDLAGRLAHTRAVRTEQLHAQRTLPVIELRVFPRAIIRLHDALGGDEFRDHHVRAQFFAERAEDHVRHARHRREINRESVGCEPWKHPVNMPEKRAASSVHSFLLKKGSASVLVNQLPKTLFKRETTAHKKSSPAPFSCRGSLAFQSQ